MAVLNRRRVTAAAMAGAMVLGVSSCSFTPDLGPTPVEQSAQPSPASSVSPSGAPETEAFELKSASEEDWTAYADGYEFSEQPQGPPEQWLFDTFPDLWEQGVRAIHPSTNGILVQYVGGERAEGTRAMPLGFRGKVGDVNEFPTDVFLRDMEYYKGEDQNISYSDEIDPGFGGYTVFIQEHYFHHRGEVTTTSMKIRPYGLYGHEAGSTAGAGGQRNYDHWEDAWAFIEENGFLPNGPEARTLYPGEIVSVWVVQENARSRDTVIRNPETGEWEIISSHKHPN